MSAIFGILLMSIRICGTGIFEPFTLSFIRPSRSVPPARIFALSPYWLSDCTTLSTLSAWIYSIGGISLSKPVFHYAVFLLRNLRAALTVAAMIFGYAPHLQ